MLNPHCRFTHCALLLTALPAFLIACGAPPPPQISKAADLAPAPAAAPDLKSLAQAEYPDLERLYTTIHQSPELSLAEEKTSARLAGELRKAGFDVSEHVGGFGVVA